MYRILFINMKLTERQTLMRQPVPASLTASRIALHILIIVNWLYGAAILVLLVASFTNEVSIMAALHATKPLFWGMKAVALLGLVSIPLFYVILRRLLDMVESVRGGDPFVRQNASRLETIARAVLGLQLLSLVIAVIAKVVSTPDHPLRLNAGFSTSGWLAVLLLFVLARVFAEGARMRDELEGTV